MKNKSNKPQVVPELFRKSDEIYAAVRLSNSHVVTICRRKAGAWDKPRWSAAQKAKTSWSGGNGSQTPEETEEMAVWLKWASSVARNMNVRNPDKVTCKDILWTLHY